LNRLAPIKTNITNNFLTWTSLLTLEARLRQT
jgi:hypothetical protein